MYTALSKESSLLNNIPNGKKSQVAYRVSSYSLSGFFNKNNRLFCRGGPLRVATARRPPLHSSPRARAELRFASSEQSPLCFVSAIRRKLRPLPCSSSSPKSFAFRGPGLFSENFTRFLAPPLSQKLCYPGVRFSGPVLEGEARLRSRA